MVMRAISILRLDDSIVVARKEAPPEEWGRIAVFDLDGVLVDPTERIKNALESVGLEPPLTKLPSDQYIRSKFWREFYSPDSLKLDKPIEESLRMALDVARSGGYVAVVSGRPESVIEHTARALEDIGLEWHLLVHRAKGNLKLDGLLKAHALRKLTPRAIEYHDDRLENLILVDSAVVVAKLYRHLNHTWYNIPCKGVRLVSNGREELVSTTTLAVDPQPYKYPVRLRWMIFESTIRDPSHLSLTASRISVIRTAFRRNPLDAPDIKPSLIASVWVDGEEWRIPLEVISMARGLGLRP